MTKNTKHAIMKALFEGDEIMLNNQLTTTLQQTTKSMNVIGCFSVL